MADSNPSVARALVNPVGLGVAAGAATVAIALTNPLIGIIGGGVYLATVAIDAIRRRASKAKKKKHANVFGMRDPDDIHDEARDRPSVCAPLSESAVMALAQSICTLARL